MTQEMLQSQTLPVLRENKLRG